MGMLAVSTSHNTIPCWSANRREGMCICKTDSVCGQLVHIFLYSLLPKKHQKNVWCSNANQTELLMSGYGRVKTAHILLGLGLVDNGG